MTAQEPVMNGLSTEKEETTNDHIAEPVEPSASPVPPIALTASTPPTTDSPTLPLNPTVDGSINPVKTPFIHPTQTSKPTPHASLTPDQQTKYNSLLNKAQFWSQLPSTTTPTSPTPPEKTPLTDSERMWLTRDCLLRYLRASKWSEPLAAQRIQATLLWRREYGVESHTAEYISEENETGKQVVLGYDNEGRPCLYLNPHKQNTKGKEKQIQHLVFMLERCIDLMPAGQETLALLVNFKESRKGDGASVGQGRETLSILQNHYPERLGRACVKDVPWVIWGFFKLITPFIDPLTKQKLKFDEDLRLLVPPEQLLKSYGGDVEFEYVHEVYWPALIGLAESRRKSMWERWEQGGKRVGESEAFLKGVGESVSVGDEKGKEKKLGVETPKLRRTASFQDDAKE
ncbi:hypothetical protein JMJ35_009680 [Cladonia borealis]|uniref:CRAL-TRIO domain-containing protein n=1 Tax=Cladonia borealis TaxID=184061 RepID=A0AA39U4S7_9LECA|nr:hypothetical protein JMJ35_009680 [Cladonia borealis]